MTFYFTRVSFYKILSLPFLSYKQDAYSHIRMLEEAGFRRIRSTVQNYLQHVANVLNQPPCCSDVLWINEGRREQIGKAPDIAREQSTLELSGPRKLVQ